jgi:hypothetical protein
MARKKKTRRPPKPPPATPPPAQTAAERPGVTAERFSRLYRLVSFLGDGPKTRDRLTTHLGLDVRGFYRDLEVLRAFGIEVTLSGGQYSLTGGLEQAAAQLPYPDPHVTLGEMRQLAKGRTQAHRKIQEQIEELLK